VNALADQRVADYFNDTFVCTYLKVGTFQIINGQKVGGNVASYFCLADGSVLHALPGQMDANKLLREARWAYETRKAALTHCTNLVTGEPSMKKYETFVKKAHTERFNAELYPGVARNQAERPLPIAMPQLRTQQAQAHWLLARNPLDKIDSVYPIVWTQILREQLSGLPVEQR
jgi:hypothetical protein